jgi:hypothetical protein
MEVEERFLKEKEVSELTGISITALRNWRAKKKGFQFCKVSKCVRYPLKDLLSYFEQNKQLAIREDI